MSAGATTPGRTSERERKVEAAAAAPPLMRVAAFDFDGTLTAADSFLPFLVSVCGQRAVTRAAALEAFSLVRGLQHSPRRDAAKERLVARLLAGRESSAVDAAGVTFAQRLIGRLHAETLERLRWHAAQGHSVVIVSASLGAYLRPVGAALGATAVLCTELEIDGAGRLTGALDGRNVRGAEKARRLSDWLAGRPAEVWAYGDSPGDRELLALSDHPAWIRPARRWAPLRGRPGR